MSQAVQPQVILKMDFLMQACEALAPTFSFETSFSFQFDKQNDILVHYVENDYKWDLHKALVEIYGFENLMWTTEH